MWKTFLILLVSVLIIRFNFQQLQQENQQIEEENHDSRKIIEDEQCHHGIDFIEYVEQRETWKIKNVNWEGQNQNQIKKISKQGEPVLIKNSPVVNWKAYSNWNRDYLKQKLEGTIIPGVVTSNVPYLIYQDPEKKLLKIPGFDDDKRLLRHSKENLNFNEFISFATNETDNKFVYFIANSNKGNLFNWIKEDISPISEFKARSNSNSNPNLKVQPQVWIGEKNLISLLHYDASHNFFVQLKGNKTFALFPPIEASKLQLYPWIHPGDAHTQFYLWKKFPNKKCFHSQINHQNDSEWFFNDNFPDIEKVDSMEVVFHDLEKINGTIIEVSKGQVLYIPPYWLHQVVSKNLDTIHFGQEFQKNKEKEKENKEKKEEKEDDQLIISVSLITQSEAQEIIEMIERVPVPIRSDWTNKKKRRFIGQLISQIHQKISQQDSNFDQEENGILGLLLARFRVWLKVWEDQIKVK